MKNTGDLLTSICPSPQPLSGLISALSGLESEWAYLRPERTDLRLARADFRPERADFRPEIAWGDEQTDKQKSPVFHRTLSPSGPLPKKKVANVLDDQRHPMLLNVNGDMLEREVAAPWGPMAYAGVRGIKEHFIFLSLI